MNSKFLKGNLKKKYLKDLRVDGRVKFTWVTGEKGGIFWTGLVWLSTRTSDVFCKHGIDPSGCTKFEEIPLLVEGLGISQEEILCIALFIHPSYTIKFQGTESTCCSNLFSKFYSANI